MIVDDDLHDLSLQGPAAVDFLAKHVPGIRDLKYFHHMPAQLFGRPVHDLAHRLHAASAATSSSARPRTPASSGTPSSREGKSLGIIPTCFATLDMLRVESCLLFYPYDMSQMYPFEKDPPGDSLWELGLDFTVSPGKTDFRGAEQHYRLKGKERFKIFGLLVDGDVAGRHGRCGVCRRQAGRRRDLRHVFDAHEEVDGACPAGCAGRGARQAAGDPRQDVKGRRHGAHSAVRRSGQEEAHAVG